MESVRFFAAFKYPTNNSLLERLVALATFANVIHVELIAVYPGGKVESIGAVQGRGVTSTSPRTDAFYELYDNIGTALNPTEATFGWKWVEITQLLREEVCTGSMDCLEWIHSQIGKPYRNTVYLTFWVPFVKVKAFDKPSFICSELVADFLLTQGTSTDNAIRNIKEACQFVYPIRRLFGECGTDKLSPQDLLQSLLSSDKVVCHSLRSTQSLLECM